MTHITAAQLDEWKLRLSFTRATLPKQDALTLIAAFEEAREALKPFAEIGKAKQKTGDTDGFTMWISPIEGTPISTHDFRRAAKVGG